MKQIFKIATGVTLGLVFFVFLIVIGYLLYYGYQQVYMNAAYKVQSQSVCQKEYIHRPGSTDDYFSVVYGEVEVISDKERRYKVPLTVDNGTIMCSIHWIGEPAYWDDDSYWDDHNNYVVIIE